MHFRSVILVFFVCFTSFFGLIITPSALALTSIKLFDLSYQDCPADLAQGAVVSGSSRFANCFIITGKAQNALTKPFMMLTYTVESMMLTMTPSYKIAPAWGQLPKYHRVSVILS